MDGLRGGRSFVLLSRIVKHAIARATTTSHIGILKPRCPWCNPPTGTVATFEKDYAKLMGSKFCVATGSGTQSLHTCVEALGIGAGDEVITSPYTWLE